MQQDHRLINLKNWLETLYPEYKIKLTPIQGDASFRRYFRSQINNTSYIMMDSPPDTEPLQPFINSTKHLENCGVNVPRIYHQNIELGYLVLDDFGKTDFFKALNTKTADLHYKNALDELVKIQTCHNNSKLPKFDHIHIYKELSLFNDWFLKKQCGIDSVNLEKTYEILADNCLKQPYVTIHRDYHCRNLMLLANNKVGIIDHQDLMQGPLCYDVASLLKDCYIDWPLNKVKQWIEYYQSISPLQCENFFLTFELTGLQRHLKAIGIFSRLAHLYNNDNYLKYIPKTLKYVQAIADREPNLKELAQLIRRL